MNQLSTIFKSSAPKISDEAKRIFDALGSIGGDLEYDEDGWDFLIRQQQLADSTLIDFLTDVNQSEKSLSAYQKYLKQTSSATSTLSVITSGAGKVMKIFAATAINAFASVVVAKAIGEIIEAYDNWVHRIDNAKDAMEQSKESYGEVSDELDELRKQAHEAQAKMAQMERTGLINDDEYKKLQETNAELEREIKLLEARQKIAATEAWDNAEDWYDKTRQHTFSGADTTYNEKASLNQENASYNNYELYDEAMIENNKDNINFLLGSYKGLSKLQEENIVKIKEEKDALAEKDEAASQAALNIIQGYEDQNETLNSNLADIQTYLDEYRSGLDDLVTAYEQKEQLGSYISSDDTAKYNEAIALIRIIDELLIGSSNNADQASESFSNAADAINRFEISDSTKAEALTKINALKDGFDSLKDLYNSISEDKALDFSILDEDFEQIFSGAEAYQDFIDVITDSPDDIKGCQEAFDNLIYSWLHSEDIMSVLNDETVDMIGAFLEEQGVVDATSWLMAELAARKEMASGKTVDLSEATREEVEAFYEEYDATEDVKQALARLQLAKITLNGTVIDTSGDIDNLIALAEQAGATAEMLAATKNYNQVLQGYNTTVGDDILESDYLDAQKKAKAELRSVIDYKPGEGKGSSGNNSSTSGYNPPSSSSKSSSSSSSKNPKQEEIDWIARRKELLEQLHQVQQEIADDETATYAERLSALDSLIEKDRERAQVAQEAASRYEQAWLEASANLTEEDKEYVINGGNDIKKYDSQELADKGIVDSVEAGEKYIENLKKAIEYRDLMTESQREELANRKEMILHEKTKIDLLKTELDLQQDLNGAITDQINSQMELLEAEGKYVNESYYKDLLQQSKESQSIVEDKLDVLYDELDAAKEAGEEYDGILVEIEQCKNEIVQCQVEQAELNDTIKRLPIERLQMFRDLYAQIVEDMDNYMSLQASIGLNPSKEELQQYIDLYNEQIDSALKQQSALKDLLDDYSYGSQKFNDTSKEIQELDNDISSLLVNINELNYQMLQIPVTEMTEEVEKLATLKDALNNSIAEDNAKGLQTTVEQYRDLHSITLQQLSVLAKQKSTLTELLDVYDEESDYYKETVEQINQINGEMSQLVQETYKWSYELLNLPIENLENVNSNLQLYSSILGDVISEYDSALSGINTLIDREIEGIEKELELLEQVNKARSIELSLEQAKYNLDRAIQQKNILAIKDGQQVWINDIDAERDAKEQVASAEYDKMVYSLEQQKEYLDSIKEKWQEIKEEIEEAANIQDANDMFGIDSNWQDKVLSGSDDDLLTLFKQLYESASMEKESVDKQVESNERISQMMNEFVTRYQEGSLTYQQALDGINKLLSSMGDGLSAIENLSGMMDLDNIASIGDIASSTQGSITESAELLKKYIAIVESNKQSVEGFETSWDSMSGAVKETVDSFNAAVDSMDAYLEAFVNNSNAISEHTNSWEEMQSLIAEQVEALKKAAEALEKAQKSSSSGSSFSGGGSSKSDNDGGTYIRVNGTNYHESEGTAAELFGKYGTQEEKDMYRQMREDQINAKADNSGDEGWRKAALDALDKELEEAKFHNGVFNGSVGSTSGTKLDDELQKLAQPVMDSDERIIKTQVGEYVYQPEQILNTIENAQRMALPPMEELLPHLFVNSNTKGLVNSQTKQLIDLLHKEYTSPSIDPINSSSNSQVIDFSIGELHLHEVNDADGLANALDQTFELKLRQNFSKYFK